MTTENTVGLSLREAAVQAEAELSLTDEGGGEAVISPTPLVDALELEQPAVEEETDSGLFDELVEQDEQPEEDSVTVEVDGEVRTFTHAQLRDGIMMQADYTRKTQEIADRERAAEKAITLMKLLETRPVETVARLSRQVNSGTPFSFESASDAPITEQTEVPTDIDALVNARVAEAMENDPRIQAVQRDSAVAQVNEAFAEIEGMYDVSLTDSDKQVVLQRASDMDTVDLKFVFGGLYAQTQRSELAKANAKASATAKPQNASDLGLAPVEDVRYDSFRSALEASIAEDQGLETVSNL